MKDDIIKAFDVQKKIRRYWKRNPATYVKENGKKTPKNIKHKKMFWDEAIDG